MASHVHVVLTEEIPSLGKHGDLVRVRAGYARNFLVPRGLGIAANESNRAQIEHAKKLAESRANKVRAEAQELATKLQGVTLTFAMAVGESDKLFGSVTHKDIEEALAKQGFSVDRRRIEAEHLKELGSHSVKVRLAPGVDATVTVKISAKK